jgi:RNA polymerase sigma-70 factor, ECF subfamily
MESLKDEFLDILSRYQGILHKVSLIYFRNQADREDNFQEITYQLWKSYPSLQNKDSIGSWIYAVSINTSISRLKKNSKIEYRDNLPDLADSIDTIEKITETENIQILLKAIYNLSVINKTLMLLYLEEKSYDEIAEILGMTKSNVGTRINRAKEILKHNLKHLNHG